MGLSVCTVNKKYRHNSLPPLPPHPWWQYGKIEEDGTVLLIKWECTQLGDGTQWSKGLIDGNSQTGWAAGQLLLYVVGLTITWGKWD